MSPYGWIELISATKPNLTASGRPGLKGVVIRHSEFDPYRHLAFPGGVRNDLILTAWGRMVGDEDRSEACLADVKACPALGHLKPVDGDEDYRRARRAAAGHQVNFRTDTRKSRCPSPPPATISSSLCPYSVKRAIFSPTA